MTLRSRLSVITDCSIIGLQCSPIQASPRPASRSNKQSNRHYHHEPKSGDSPNARYPGEPDERRSGTFDITDTALLRRLALANNDFEATEAAVQWHLGRESASGDGDRYFRRWLCSISGTMTTTFGRLTSSFNDEPIFR